MCGIAGYSTAGAVPELAAAVASIAHRGPDSSGVHVEDDHHVGLGHTRLAIIDLSPLGAQPMISADGHHVLIFNGEIYNHIELRGELEAAGCRLKGSSDTEVLLELLVREGVDALSRLNGIFALALLDRRTGDLLVARDAFGVKPVYFCATQDAFVFGSEIKALLAMGVAPLAPDPVEVNRYLTFLWCPGEGTPARNIRKLGPGEAMLVRSGAIVQRFMWRKSPALSPKPLQRSIETIKRELADCLRRAVHRQMIADVPVGAFLSGGLDSSAVVAFAREKAPDIRCFTIDISGGAEQGTVDDLPYAREVANHLGVRLETVRVDAARMARDLESLVAQLDEPLADPAALSVRYISELARAQGVKVLLSGAGGDDIFSGYRRHRALSFGRYGRWAPKPLRDLARFAAGRGDQRNPMVRKASKLLDAFAHEGDEQLVNHFVWTRAADLQKLYTQAFRDQAAQAAAGAPMLAFLQDMAPGAADLDRVLALEQHFFLADHNLVYTDKMSMAAGVEVRVPFLDNDLVDFANSIPAGLKQKGAVGKWILKAAMEPFLPRHVIYRAKTGFGAPVRRWIRSDLRGWVRDMLAPDTLRRRGMFDAQAVQKLLDDNESGRIDASYTILSLICIELWMKHFVDQPGAATAKAEAV